MALTGCNSHSAVKALVHACACCSSYWALTGPFLSEAAATVAKLLLLHIHAAVTFGSLHFIAFHFGPYGPRALV